MIACIRIPAFAAAVAQRDDPTLAAHPLILYAMRRRSLVVSAECGVAAQHGIRPGMTLRQAQLCCPAARCRPAAPERDAQAFADVLARLARVTPRLEGACARPDAHALLDLGRWSDTAALAIAERLTQVVHTEARLPIALGVARTRLAAQLAATLAPLAGALVVPPESEALLLAACRIDRLPGAADIAERLHMLGIHTLDQFIALPPAAVLAQFGTAARALQRMVQDDDERPLRLWQDLPQEQARYQFDGPVSDRRVLVAVLQEFGRRLAARLERQGYQTRTIRLVLQLDDTTTHDAVCVLNPPTADAVALARAAEALLDAAALACGVVELTMTLTDLTALRGQQLELFARERGRHEDLRTTIHDLAARHGPGRFFRATLMDPTARLPEERVRLDAVDAL